MPTVPKLDFCLAIYNIVRFKIHIFFKQHNRSFWLQACILFDVHFIKQPSNKLNPKTILECISTAIMML